VIGNGDAMQTFGTRGGNQVFRTGDTVPGKKRMRVQIDVKWHGKRAVKKLKGYKVKSERTNKTTL
jgi:hypothetical protein